ncbi:hypothetical protein [Plantactinospora sp. CA-290183]
MAHGQDDVVNAVCGRYRTDADQGIRICRNPRETQGHVVAV